MSVRLFKFIAWAWVEHHYLCWAIGLVIGAAIGVGIAEYHVRSYT